MLKQRISSKQWSEIGIYSYAKDWVRPFCKHTLIKEPNGRFKREQRISWLPYLILLLPACFVQFFWCCWDGGIKEFVFPERYLGGDWFTPGSESYKRAEKIWDSK